MDTFQLYFTAEEPLVISDGTAEGMKHTSLMHIPGSMILGAMAELWKKRKGFTGKADGDAEFDALFIHGAVSWGHALPTCDARACVPVPLCWEYVKDKGRLPVYGSHVKNEALIFNLLHSPKDSKGLTAKELEDPEVCAWKKVHDKHLKRKRVPEGFVDMHSLCAPKVEFQHNTHVALDVKKRSAQDGQLFAYESISRGTNFCSTVYCEAQWSKALSALLQEGECVRVGHSRSAGYGSVRLTECKKITENTAEHLQKTQEQTLYLSSDYFPKQSWAMPLEALKSELESIFGEITWNIEKTYCKETRLESFHGQWRLPRPTRHGLQAGSVLTFTCNATQENMPTVLPTALGAWQHEGFGRFLLNSTFLQKLQIIPEQPHNVQKTDNNVQITKSGKSFTEGTIPPFLAVWRQRSFLRMAHEQALCVWQSVGLWRHFFEGLANTHITQSQRGNMRSLISTQSPEMWTSSFTTVLGKTPGKQWINAKVPSPFTHGREHMDKIMLSLLNMQECDELLGKAENIDWTVSTVAGGSLLPHEEKLFRQARHKRLLLELLRRWEKDVRSLGTENEEKRA